MNLKGNTPALYGGAMASKKKIASKSAKKSAAKKPAKASKKPTKKQIAASM